MTPEQIREHIKYHDEDEDTLEGYIDELLAYTEAQAKQIEQLRRYGIEIIGVLDAHEIDTFDCDGTDEKYCDCLERAIKKFKAVASEAIDNARET